MTTYWCDTGVTISGDLDIGGRNLFYGYWFPSALDGITAFAGGGFANATSLTDTFSIVSTVASDHDSVKLYPAPIDPTAGITGPVMWVHNESTQFLDVYPGNALHYIAGHAQGDPYVIYPEVTIGFYPESSTKWHLVSADPLVKTLNPTITADPAGTLASAYQMKTEYNIVTVCAGIGDSVKLVGHQWYDSGTKTGSPVMIVHNTTVRACDVYPNQAAHQIDALGAGNPYRVNGGATRTFVPVSTTAWVSIR